MLDFGWVELLIIIIVAVFVVGPKDIPHIMQGIGRFVRRFQYVKFAISQQFDELMQAGDIEELRKGVNFEQRSQQDVQKDIQNEQDEDAEFIEANENSAEPKKEEGA
ncbi:MAG: twin-arginine translocase TatA/TatE family subunit [Pseudomonadota bacterium]